MEYAGYGFYKDNGSASEAKIKEDAETVFRFILQQTEFKAEDILVFGRSMGSGPACFLAGNFKLGGLIV